MVVDARAWIALAAWTQSGRWGDDPGGRLGGLLAGSACWAPLWMLLGWPGMWPAPPGRPLRWAGRGWRAAGRRAAAGPPAGGAARP